MGHSTTLGYRFSGRRIATLIAAAAALAVAAALLVAVLGPVSQAPATHVAPVVQPGNPSCPGGTTTLTIQAGDIDDLGVGESRTFNQGALSVTITVTAVNAEGEPTAFSFTSNSPVTQVIVKGGPNANVYTFAAPGVTSDTGLTAPEGKGISHISFCFPPPVVTTTSTTTTTAPTTTTSTTTTTAPTTTTTAPTTTAPPTTAPPTTAKPAPPTTTAPPTTAKAAPPPAPGAPAAVPPVPAPVQAAARFTG